MNKDEIEILEYLRRFDSGHAPLRKFESGAITSLICKGLIETGAYFGSWRITDAGRLAYGEARKLRLAQIAQLRKAEAHRDPEAVRASLDEMDAADAARGVKVIRVDDGVTIAYGQVSDRCSEFYVRAWQGYLRRDPAGSLSRPWNRPETLAKIAPLGESPWRCAPTKPTPPTGT